MLGSRQQCRGGAAAAAGATPVSRSSRIIIHNSQRLVSNRHLTSVLASAASAEATPEQQQDNQQQQQQQRQQRDEEQASSYNNKRTEKYTRARVKRLANRWEDESTPNTGVVSITGASKVPGAAACVAADFKTNRITRIVPSSEEWSQRALDTVRLATRMINNSIVAAEEQGGDGDAEDGGSSSSSGIKQTLVFQPVEVVGDLAAPPLMPLGATVLYTSCLPIDNAVLQAALSRRAAGMAAAAAAQAAGAGREAASPSGDGQALLQQVYLGPNSDFVRVAGALNQALSREGWAELVCLGRFDYTAPLALQTLVKLRRIRYGRHQDDVSAVLLGDEDGLGPAARSQPARQQGARAPVSLLLMRCAKNYATKLLSLEQQHGSAGGS